MDAAGSDCGRQLPPHAPHAAPWGASAVGSAVPQREAAAGAGLAPPRAAQGCP